MNIPSNGFEGLRLCIKMTGKMLSDPVVSVRIDPPPPSIPRWNLRIKLLMKFKLNGRVIVNRDTRPRGFLQRRRAGARKT